MGKYLGYKYLTENTITLKSSLLRCDGTRQRVNQSGLKHSKISAFTTKRSNLCNTPALTMFSGVLISSTNSWALRLLGDDFFNLLIRLLHY